MSHYLSIEIGYRLYDDEALKTLQQVLFFKELDFQLKDIKEIMENPGFDKIEAFKKQKELIRVKRDRLDGLLKLLEKLEKGESSMSFKEFDMSEYLQVLEQFKAENAEEVIKNWGSVEAFEQMINMIKDNESEIAKMAVSQYGSIEKYTEAMKENLNHFSENMERFQSIKNNDTDYLERHKALTARLFADVTKDTKSKESFRRILSMDSLLFTGEQKSGRNWLPVLGFHRFNCTGICAGICVYVYLFSKGGCPIMNETFIEILKAVLFGVVEGITEWLPISSTGHLILLNQFVVLNASKPYWNMFKVVIQLGAILAVVAIFWDQIFPFGKKDNPL